MTEQPFFFTDDLAVGYHGSKLIDHICIGVQRGQILTLIGPNGAGKSTILKTIARQLEAIAGTVYIDKTEVSAYRGRAFAQRVSVLMTERIAPERMTCRDIVESGRYPYTGQLGLLSDDDRKAAEEAMSLTAVTEIADRDFNQISDGQRQRVMLARAICQEPEILILDEPTSFLDIRHKLELLNILKKLVREKNLAVILSMHELDLAQRISDYVVCIRGNRIDQCGPPDIVLTGEYITSLYGIPTDSYSAYYGSAELEAPMGTPQVFVIAGNGSGCHTFRSLQRRNIPFAAGILFENDIDYPAAKALAAEVVAAPAFEPVSHTLITHAMTLMDCCKKVLCCPERFGSLDTANRQLAAYAAQKNYMIPTQAD